MSANNSMLSNLHLKLSTSGLRFFYYPFYFIGMAVFYTFTAIFASVKWVALSPFKLIAALPEIIMAVCKGIFWVVAGIFMVWFSPALLLKKLELDFLANIVGMILLIVGIIFFEYAIKDIIISRFGDLNEIVFTLRASVSAYFNQ